MDIRARIRERRTAAGLTRKALADQIGVDASTIYKIEGGYRDPSLETLREMARVFRDAGKPFPKQVQELLGGSPKPTPAPTADTAAA